MSSRVSTSKVSATIERYAAVWNARGEVCAFAEPPQRKLEDFAVLRFAPRPERSLWTYATCGLDPNLELHVHVDARCDDTIAILYAIAHYHRTAAPLDLHHTVNFGRPWVPQSLCTHGFISRPYLDGPTIEWSSWLIPITEAELALKKRDGVEALESAFENAPFLYASPLRPSVV